MSKNYFNVNDNYPKSCNCITCGNIKIAKRKAKSRNPQNSAFMKAKIAKNKWEARQFRKALAQ